jgi:hypothetical protein
MARKMKVCTITTSNDVIPNASNPLTLIGIEKTPTPSVKKPKTAKTVKIGKTFSLTKSDLQVESSSGTSKLPNVVSGDLEVTVDLNASFDIT